MSSRFALAAILIACASPAFSQDCELHVWPSGQINAVDKDNSAHVLGDMITVTSTYTTVDPVGRSIGEAIGPERQIGLIRAFELERVAGLAAFRPVFHTGEVAPADFSRHWLDKDFAEGGRLSSSQSDCYAELHVVAVTYLDQPMKDTLHTIFVLRYFGDADMARLIATDGGYHKTQKVSWTSDEQAKDGRRALATSFSENLRKFFMRRKVKRLLAHMASFAGD